MRMDFPHPIEVLIAIRDEKANNLRELMEFFGMNDSAKVQYYGWDARLNSVLKNLLEAGLIVRSEEKLKSSPQLSKIQSVLELSLTELLERRQIDSITVIPLFGKPAPYSTKADVFVLMPFSPELKPIYTDHIGKVTKGLDLSAARADDFFNTHDIIQDVWQGIATSKLIVADCTGKNPNVFYEIGIAHSVGKPVILISQTLDDIPFDLRHRRVIIYKYTPPGMMEFEKQLTETIRSTLRE
jgi:hypothetical protein